MTTPWDELERLIEQSTDFKPPWTWDDLKALEEAPDGSWRAMRVVQAEMADIHGPQLRRATAVALIEAAHLLRKEPKGPGPLVLTSATLGRYPDKYVWAAIRRFCSMVECGDLCLLLPFLQSEDYAEVQVSCQGIVNILCAGDWVPEPIRHEVGQLSRKTWDDSPKGHAVHGSVYVAAKLLGFEGARKPKYLFREDRKILGLPLDRLPWDLV